MANAPVAAILTIGTEITTGQIHDTNMGWLAEHLTDLDWDVVLSLSVPDDTKAIHEALDFAATKAKQIVVTGGLGPTRDDLTRGAIASWCGVPLNYDTASWTRIEERFKKLGLPNVEANRQQCFFPEGAKILTNRVGTANAFRIEERRATLWILPGPPVEIQAIWQDHLSEFFAQAQGHSARKELLRWQTLGLSEARIGELVEEAIKGSSLVSGYRPHFPYTEVKIWTPSSDKAINQSYLDRMEQALAPWVVGRDDADPAMDMVQALIGRGRVAILDEVSQGHISRRLSEALGRLLPPDNQHRITIILGPDLEHAPHADGLLLSARPGKDAASWIGGMRDRGQHAEKLISTPFKPHPEFKDRPRRFLTEMLLLEWRRMLMTLAV
jgi:molybdenum cofactor synthesis domain-containing protein